MILFDIYKREPGQDNKDTLILNAKATDFIEVLNLWARLSPYGYYFVVGKVTIENFTGGF